MFFIQYLRWLKELMVYTLGLCESFNDLQICRLLSSAHIQSFWTRDQAQYSVLQFW